MKPVRRLFGTDGMRGVANVAPMTCDMVLRLGRAVAYTCKQGASRRPRIVVGRDTRLSGDMLESALTAGICSMGADALLCGTLPTPAIAYLTRSLPADAGAVISASHNPFADNGIKLFAATGFKLPDAAENAIEALVLGDRIDHLCATGGDIGRVIRVDDAAERYKTFLKQTLPPSLRLDHFKVAIDCAHGAAYEVGPQVLRELGAEVVAVGVGPNGENINHEHGALHPQRLQEIVRVQRAHVGLALDGDADRAMLVDENAEVVDGDEVLAMMAVDMLARGTLKQRTVVATLMSNIGLEIALREHGARLLRVQVGDRYVVEEMRRQGCNLGGEQSGHLLFLDHSTTGDGLLAGLHVMRLMTESGRPLSELRRAMSKFPQVLLNVPVTERRELEDIPPLRQMLDRIRAALNDRGRVLVRYSGTEPLVRVMVEGEVAEQVRLYAEEIAAAVRAHLAA